MATRIEWDEAQSGAQKRYVANFEGLNGLKLRICELTDGSWEFDFMDAGKGWGPPRILPTLDEAKEAAAKVVAERERK